MNLVLQATDPSLFADSFFPFPFCGFEFLLGWPA